VKEADLHRLLMKEASAKGARLFRNNVGMAWTGKLVSNRGGVVVLDGARPFHAGMGTGSSDLIGYTQVKIEPAHVGKTVAVFTSVEVKVGRNQPSDEQQMWITAIDLHGGISGVARSVADLHNILRIT